MEQIRSGRLDRSAPTADHEKQRAEQDHDPERVLHFSEGFLLIVWFSKLKFYLLRAEVL